MNLVFAIWMLNSLLVEGDKYGDSEIKLRELLFKNRKIDANTRPVQLHNETIHVQMELGIAHIVQLDDTREILTFNGEACFHWDDINFEWDPKEYGNIDILNVDSSMIWTPDIYVINSAKAEDFTMWRRGIVYATHYGRLIQCSMNRFESTCPMDLRHFPFDEHTCTIYFTPWSHSRRELTVSILRANQSVLGMRFDQNNEWEVLSSYGNMTFFYFKCCPDNPFPYPTFHLQMRRRAPFYYCALLLPCAIGMLLTIIVFWIPPNTTERFVLGSINVLTLTVMVAHLYWIIPHSGSQPPTILVFGGTSLLFTGLALIISLVSTSFIINMPEASPPSIVTTILTSGLATLILWLPSDNQTVSESELSNVVGSESTQKSLSSHAKEWLFVSVAIDRVGFYVYILTFVSLACYAAYG